mgnify:FL=1|jgi:hypothetical protein|nr:MAG TPA: hypothetical protein [Caudoviricetes sp.]
MSKAVMLSIRPKWCEKIVNGEKTIEVRKTRPKLETPFKCYIYETQGWVEKDGIMAFRLGGRVIGEFTCDRIYGIGKRGIPENFDYCYLSLNEWGNDDIEVEIRAISASCVSKEELNAYGSKAPFLYGWHITDLKIYNTPKELSKFFPVCKYKNDDGSCPSRRVACSYQKYDYNPDGSINLVECGRTLERPPQSWCYVEAME